MVKIKINLVDTAVLQNVPAVDQQQILWPNFMAEKTVLWISKANPSSLVRKGGGGRDQQRICKYEIFIISDSYCFL